MDQAMYTAASGAMAMELKLAVISNNIANVDTTGFKKDHVSFESYIKQLSTDPLVPVQYQRVSEDVVTKEYSIDTTQGQLRQTGNPLDVALAGEGYFVVATEQGLRYTRAGSFQRTTDGFMADQQGNIVQGEGGGITIGNGEVIIGRDGTVSVDGTTVGRLQVVTIAPESLVKSGKNLFEVAPGVTPASAETPDVQQGSIELSNVDTIKEMLGLIQTQRAYEAFQKMITSVSESYGQSIQRVGMVE